MPYAAAFVNPPKSVTTATNAEVTMDAGSTQQKVKHDRKTEKKCIKCKDWHPKATHFGKHDTSSDGYQSICKTCKGLANKKAREKNIAARLRHHVATRCLDQLGQLAPAGFTRNLDEHLGYSIQKLVRHLRKRLHEREGEDRKLKDALNEGYHVDHIRPLSSFTVIRDGSIDWDEFQRCWAIENLEAIPAGENLAKSNKWDGETSSPQTAQGNRVIPEGVRFP